MIYVIRVLQGGKFSNYVEEIVFQKKKTILHGFSDKKLTKFHSTIPEGKQIFWKICYWQNHWVPVGSLVLK